MPKFNTICSDLYQIVEIKSSNILILIYFDDL